MRGGAFVAGVLVVAGLAGCVKQAAPPPPPPPVNPAPSAPANEPEALMAALRGLVEQAGVGDDIREREIEAGDAYEPCDLLIADPDQVKGGGLEIDQVWGAGLEVNPVSSFADIQRPTTLLDVTVIGLPDAAAAVAAARAARTAPCPREAFRLNIGMATARWDARTVTIESTSARLTTATVSRVPGRPSRPAVNAATLALAYARPQLVRRRGSLPLGRRLRVDNVHPWFIADTIRHYVDHPQHRAAIGEPAEYQRLLHALTSPPAGPDHAHAS